MLWKRIDLTASMVHIVAGHKYVLKINKAILKAVNVAHTIKILSGHSPPPDVDKNGSFTAILGHV